MVGGTAGRESGGASRQVLGKRGRDQSVGPAEPKGPRGRGRPRKSRPEPLATGQKGARGTPNVSSQKRATVRTSTTTDNDISSLSVTSTTKSTTIGPYNRRFRQKLIDHHVLPLDDDTKYPDPDNMEEIRNVLNRVRTWGPDFETKAQAYRDRLVGAMKENDVEALLGLHSIPGDTKAMPQGSVFKRNQSRWSELATITDGNTKPAQPDMTYATKAGELKQPIRDHLRDKIMPPADEQFICPNFMIAVKGPGGSTRVNDLQAVHAGALAARGMHAIWSYGSRAEAVDAEVDTGKIARTITCTWKDGIFIMYASYRLDPQGSEEGSGSSVSTSSTSPTYCTKLIDTWIFNTYNNEKLKEGFAAYLNGLEWAQEQRDEAIERANRRYKEDERTERTERAEKIPSNGRRGHEQRRSLEIAGEEIIYRGEVDEGLPAHERSGDDSPHHNDPGDSPDLQQTTWSFTSADSQRTITRSRSRRIEAAAGTGIPQLDP